MKILARLRDASDSLARLVFLATAFGLCGALPAAAATLLSFNSLQGDYIGQGVAQSWTPANGTFTAQTNFASGIQVNFNGASNWWTLEFSSGTGAALQPGTYTAAPRFPFNPAGSPGLSVFGTGRGCNESLGRFTVLEVAMGPGGVVDRFAADFEQHCEFGPPALLGAVRFNSNVPVTSASLSAPASGLQPLGPLSFTLAPNASLANAVSLRALDSGGSPVGGALVSFLASPPCGAYAGRIWTTTTAAGDGTATMPAFTAFSSPGTCTITASVAGGATVTYNINVANAPAAVSLMAPARRGAAIRAGSVFTESIHVRALDSAGAGVVGATVTFSAPPGCGTFGGASSAAVSTQPTEGNALMPAFTASATSQRCVITASLPNGASLGYNVTIYQPSDITATVSPASPLQINASSSFQARVRVLWQSQPLPDLLVQIFFSPWVGGSPNPGLAGDTYVITDANGEAVGNFQANEASGTHQLAFGTPDPGGFNLAVLTLVQSAPTNLPRTFTAPSPSGDGDVTIAIVQNSTASCGFGSARFIDPRVTTLPPGRALPAGLTFAGGLFDIRAEGCGNGRPITFSLQHPAPLLASASLWLHGPTADRADPHWYSVPITINGNSASFTLVDGGTGDTDGATNGTVAAFGGIAFTYQDMWWSGGAENGWGLSITQHGETIFAVIYAYGPTGAPTWYVMSGGTWNAARTAYTGAVYVPRGSPYFAYDFSRFTVGPSVGTLTITFSAFDRATVDYTFNGVTGRKSILRQAFGPQAPIPLAGAGDMWWGGPLQNGWGVAVLQQFAALFSVWFTYDAAGMPTWFVMPSGTWTSSDTYEGRIYRTTGSPWLGAAYDPAALRVTDAGSFRLRFGDGNALLEYTLEGRSGTLVLSRQPF